MVFCSGETPTTIPPQTAVQVSLELVLAFLEAPKRANEPLHNHLSREFLRG